MKSQQRRHTEKQIRRNKKALKDQFDYAYTRRFLQVGDAIKGIRLDLSALERIDKRRAKIEKPKDKTSGRNRMRVAYGKD